MRTFDASHVPVREGLLRLEAPGLVQFVPSDMPLTYGMAPFVADDLVKVALAVLSVTKLPQGRAERFCMDAAWWQVRDVAGSGESRPHPESVPINALLPIKGMRLAQRSAGRSDFSAAEQALCFLAGANSVFYGDVLLPAPNAGTDADAEMFAALGALEDA
ncbi:hypothetical protein [Ruegeria pomeroyi]|uniref:hypothetical protein n=1 Tax=Ruegeria pomeroyi TaxID=89184 RepID=UPI0031F3E2B2